MQNKTFDKMYPALMKEWDFDKNEDEGIYPDKVSRGSKIKVNWKCEKGHEWKAYLYSRTHKTKGTKCPYCMGIKVIKGENDFASVHPDLMTEWDFDKNDKLGIDATELGSYSKTKVWWICDKGHSYKTSIGVRVNNNSGCPICSGREVEVGYNDLATLRPDLLEQWDCEENEIKPTEITVGSSKTVKWKCDKCGYKWESAVYKRTSSKTGYCPNCIRGKKTSYPEQFIYSCIKELYEEAQSRRKIDNFEADISVESLKLVIEYDGIRFHSEKEAKDRDKRKEAFFIEAGWKILSVKESKLKYNLVRGNVIYLKKHTNKLEELTACMQLVIDWINRTYGTTHELCIPEDIDMRVIEQLGVSDKENSLESKYPLLAACLHSTKNGVLTADSISAKSHLNVWWTCPECGEDYQMPVSWRVRNEGNKYGKCLKCIKKSLGEKYTQAEKGKNDIESCCPTMLLDWDYEKNTRYPDTVCVRSQLLLNWKCCECGKEWTNRADKEYQRKQRGSIGCKECSRLSRKKI